MHRKSLEAAEHLKDDNCNSNSDHEETTSMRTEASDTSATSNNQQLQQNQQQPQSQQQQQQPPPTLSLTNSDKDHQHQQMYNDDPEAFRNNSIACLRAKAQEHSAKLLNHGLMLQVRSNMGQQNCDANANNLHHQDVVVKTDTNSSIF